MNSEMECMCLQCGVSNHIGMDLISLVVLEGSNVKVVKDTFCMDCGGPLMVLGKAGDQPNYQLS